MEEKYRGKAIIFAATQRSGSSMVVDDFQNVTGRPKTESEAFYRLVISAKPPVSDWAEAMGRVSALRANEVVFFDKIMFHQVQKLSQLIDETKHTPMCHPFAEYFEGATWVYIRRANLFEQAISKYIAESLNIWNTKDAESEKYNTKFEFNLKQAKVHLRALLREDEQWQAFFRRHDLTPVEIYYEDAVENFPDYLTPVFGAAGIEADLSKPFERRMEKLGNVRNETLASILMNVTMRELIRLNIDVVAYMKENRAGEVAPVKPGAAN